MHSQLLVRSMSTGNSASAVPCSSSRRRHLKNDSFLCACLSFQVLYTNHTYGAVQICVDAVVSRANADALSVDISLPVKSEQEIIDLYVKVCERNKSIKVSKKC